MSEKRKPTRRRDDDPVRAYNDGRTAYWTGGAPGVGDRKIQRCGSREAAELRATEVRKLLQRRSGSAPKGNATLDDLMRAAVAHWEKVGHPTGTIRQYRSGWNAHVPATIATPCREVGIVHYAAVFNALNEERAPQHIIDAVARTLGALVTFAVLNGYFPDGQPFGGPDLRRATVKQARATAVRQNRGRKETRIRLDEVLRGGEAHDGPVQPGVHDRLAHAGDLVVGAAQGRLGHEGGQPGLPGALLPGSRTLGVALPT